MNESNTTDDDSKASSTYKQPNLVQVNDRKEILGDFRLLKACAFR